MAMRAVLLAVILAAGAAHGQAVLEFKGLPFGSSVDQAKALFPDMRCGTTYCAAYKSDKLPPTFAGDMVQSIQMGFGPTGLDKVTVSTLPRQHDVIVKAFSEKYGKPAIEVSEFRTNGGAVAEQEQATWTFSDGGYITSMRYAGSITSSMVIMLSGPGKDRVKQEMDNQLKRAKKDI